MRRACVRWARASTREQGSYLGAGLLLAALYLSACFRLVPVCLARVRALCLSVLCVRVRGAGHRNNFAGTYTEFAGTLPGDTRVIEGMSGKSKVRYP